MTKLILLLPFFTLSLTHAAPTDSSRPSASVLEIFLNNLPTLKVAKNFDGSAPGEPAALKQFVTSLAKATAISASCGYRARSEFEDCVISIHEGTGGEGFAVARIYSFTILKDKVIGEVGVVGAL